MIIHHSKCIQTKNSIKKLDYNPNSDYNVTENRASVLNWIESNVTENKCAIIATVRYLGGYYYGYIFHAFNDNYFALEYNMHNTTVNMWYKPQGTDTWMIH